MLSTCIELPHGLKTFVLSIFDWPLKVSLYKFYAFALLFSPGPKTSDKYSNKPDYHRAAQITRRQYSSDSYTEEICILRCAIKTSFCRTR